MATYKLLANIKQALLSKKATVLDNSTLSQQLNEPLYKLTRQRSKSEIETIYDLCPS